MCVFVCLFACTEVYIKEMRKIERVDFFVGKIGGSNKKRQVFVIGFRNQRILLGKNGLELTSYYFMWESYIVFFLYIIYF